MRDTALKYLEAGLCVLPAKRDTKSPTVNWKNYQERLPTRAEVDAWFANRHDAMCIMAGKVSGYLEVIDFDHGGEMFEPWLQRVPARLHERLAIEATQNSGWHAGYRCEEPICGSKKLAQRKHIITQEDDTYTEDGNDYVRLRGKDYQIQTDGEGRRYAMVTLIETRGEKGLFVCTPTQGYELLQGDFTDLPVLTAEEREELLVAAYELNEHFTVVEAPKETRPLHPGEVLPGEDFKARGDIRPFLKKHGWVYVNSDGKNERWRRPGKTKGHSATFNGQYFYVFTSNAAPFEERRHYNPFATYAYLEHNRDFHSAASELSRQGYGSKVLGADAGGVDISAIVEQFDPGQPEEPQGTEISNPGPFPYRLIENLPSIVQTAMEYYVTNAFEAQPVMFLASFLAATGTILGHKVKDASGLRTNIFTVGALSTGGGKEATREVVDRIFQRSGLGLMCGAEEFASDAGLIKAVSVQNPILFQVDEFGRLMHSVQLGARNSPHLYNIVSVLLKLYSKANGTFRSKAYADEKRNMRIDYPHVCVYGTTVIENLWQALSFEAVLDGFLPRLMIFETPSENIEGGQKETEPPEELINFFNYWANRRITSGNMERINPSPMIVPYSAEASRIMEDFRAEQKQNITLYGELGPLWSRARENAGKLALIHACWKNSEQPTVETDSAQWAVEVTRHVVRQTLWRASLSLVDNPFHGECQKALQKLQDEPSGQLSHSVLLKRMKMKSRDFRDLIETLEQRGDVVRVPVNTSGRPSLFYQLRSRANSGVKQEAKGERSQ